MTYTRSQVSKHFDTTAETIRRWSRDFANFLSASANDSNKATYTDEDMEVMTYVQQAYADNQKTDDVIASVGGGARGEWNGELHNHTVEITEQQVGEIYKIRQERDELREELTDANKQIAVLQSQVSEVQSMRDEMKELNRQIGRLEARLEILQEQKDDEKD